MKINKYILLSFFAVIGMVSCVPDFDDLSPEKVIIMEDDPRAWQQTMSINELVAMYDRVDDIYVFAKDDTLKFEQENYSYFTVNQGTEQYPVNAVYNAVEQGQVIRRRIELTYKGKKITVCRDYGNIDSNTGMPIYKNLFTINTIESDKDIYIKGRITTIDTASNIYKYFMMESLDASKQSIKVSIDAGSLSGVFPLGQVVAVRCNGLVMGRYAEMPQIGVYGFRDDGDGVPNGKTRFEPGRIPYSMVWDHFQCLGYPDASKVVPTPVTIAQLSTLDSTWYGRLVVINGPVNFTGRSDSETLLSRRDTISIERSIKETGSTDRYQRNPIFAPSTYSADYGYNIGFPQSREIKDGSGATVCISTSEYAHFWNRFIPESNVTGESVVAILGWFHDKNNRYGGKYQLTIRSLDDLKGFGEMPVSGLTK